MSFATRTHRHHAMRSSAADRRHVQLDMPRLALDPLRSIVFAVLVVCAATSFISPFGWWGTAGAFLVLLLMTGFVLDVVFSLLADDHTGDDEFRHPWLAQFRAFERRRTRNHHAS